MFNKKEAGMMIIKPHTKKSRKATDKDAEFIAQQASEMMLLSARIEQERNLFDEVFAIHHSQVSNKPIDFFVLNPTNPTIAQKYGDRDYFIFINPKIVNHTKHTVPRVEGCLSFPGKISVTVERWNKIVLEYQSLVKQDDESFGLSEVFTEDLSGLLAQISQHENDHAEGKFIFPLGLLAGFLKKK